MSVPRVPSPRRSVFEAYSSLGVCHTQVSRLTFPPTPVQARLVWHWRDTILSRPRSCVPLECQRHPESMLWVQVGSQLPFLVWCCWNLLVTVLLVVSVHILWKGFMQSAFPMMSKWSTPVTRDCRRVFLMIGACEFPLLTSVFTNFYIVTSPPGAVMLLNPRRGA